MEQWNETEGTRDNRRYPLLERVHAGHADLLDVDSGDRVLDIGCGRNPTVDDAATTVGIDPDPRLVREARQQVGGGHVCRASAADLPFVTNAFDAVFMRGVVHHLGPKSRQATFDEVARVLKPTGRIVILEPDPESRFRQVTWAVAGLFGHEDESEHVDEEGYVTRTQIKSVCTDSGLDVVEQAASGSWLSPLAFVYPSRLGVGALEQIYDLLTASWWSKTVATPSAHPDRIAE